MDPLTPVDRELTAALQVDPSPAFVARVRARVATEPIDSRWHASGLGFVGGALAAVFFAAIMLRGGSPAGPIAPTALLPQRSAAIWAPLRDGFVPARVVRDVARAPMPPAPALVSPSEMAALQRLFSGRLVAAEWPEPPATELVVPQISIAPIVISSDPEGAGQ
jgi:hypothetical protein